MAGLATLRTNRAGMHRPSSATFGRCRTGCRAKRTAVALGSPGFARRTLMLTRRHLIAMSAASIATPALLGSARAQAWPNRFVRLIVPFPPGGGTDAIARVVAGRISEIWGQQLIVENRGGGASNIGHEAVARAEPDGYTLLMASMPLAANRSEERRVGKECRFRVSRCRENKK